MQIGYLGVVVPAQNFWQGFYINDDMASEAEAMLANLRANPPGASEVIQPYGDPDPVRDMLAKVGLTSNKFRLSDADESLLGGFCATVTSAALVFGKRMGLQDISETVAMPHPDSVVATCGYAIRSLINRDYFWIEGKPTVGGMLTTINPLYVSSVTEARDAINSLSLVTKIKRRLMAQQRAQDQITDESHYRGKPH